MEVFDVFDGPVSKEHAWDWIRGLGMSPEQRMGAGPGVRGKITGQGIHERPKLLVVLDGQGWVGSQPGEEVPMSAGHVIFWDAGEWFAAGVGEGGMDELWAIGGDLRADLIPTD